MLRKIKGLLHSDFPRTFPHDINSDEPDYPPLKDYFGKGMFLKDWQFWVVLAIIAFLIFALPEVWGFVGPSSH